MINEISYEVSIDIVQEAFFFFLRSLLFALFAGFLVPSCPKLALVLGNVCERLCTSRSLLGSYVHQESI